MANERVSPTLMNAILALDSYNRGPKQQFVVAGDKVGEYSIGKDSVRSELTTSDGTPAAALDFYAASYTRTTASGIETVISYRGTDNPDPFDANADFSKGWGVGAGFVGSIVL